MGKLRMLRPAVGQAAPLVRTADKVALPFYQSAEWRALVKRLRDERGAFCQTCGRGGRIFADHEVEVKDGGALLDPANVKLLCGGCHTRKTARERARRAAQGPIGARSSGSGARA